MVRYERGLELRDRLVTLGHAVEWHEYPMMHQVCLEELEAIGVFLRERLV
jgi:phospholipase/carboxylesterase